MIKKLIALLILTGCAILGFGYLYINTIESIKLKRYANLIEKTHSVKSSDIVAIISDSKNEYRSSVMDSIIKNRNKFYTYEFLDLFTNAKNELSKYVIEEEVATIWDTKIGRFRKATYDETHQNDMGIRFDVSKKIEKPDIRYVTIKRLDLSSAPKLRNDLIYSFAYFTLVKKPPRKLLASELDDFFNKYIFISKFADTSRDYTIEGAFIATYVKYFSLDNLINSSMARLNNLKIKEENAWLLKDVNEVIHFLTEVGTGLSQNFYQLMDLGSQRYDSVRFYLGFKILHEIGFEDPELFKLLDQDFSAYNFVITGGGEDIIINTNEEVAKLKKYLIGKKDIPIEKVLVNYISVNTSPLFDSAYYEKKLETKKSYLIYYLVLFIIISGYLIFLSKKTYPGFIAVVISTITLGVAWFFIYGQDTMSGFHFLAAIVLPVCYIGLTGLLDDLTNDWLPNSFLADLIDD